MHETHDGSSPVARLRNPLDPLQVTHVSRTEFAVSLNGEAAPAACTYDQLAEYLSLHGINLLADATLQSKLFDGTLTIVGGGTIQLSNVA